MTINNIIMQNLLLNIKEQLHLNLDKNLILSTIFTSSSNSKEYINSKDYKEATVMCLLEYIDSSFYVILTLRSQNLRDHPGQISLPGGKKNRNESFFDCGLREVNEEIGIKKKNINVLGELSMYLSGSNYLIKPLVGIVEHNNKVVLNKDEVEKVIYFPINFLFDEKNITTSSFLEKSSNKKKLYYDIYWNDIRIWGTTAIILVHLSRIISSVIFKNV